ncbi:pyridoxamine 5'-phosphate oxidase family protein [Rathayibacter soli]|uniref:pyridoxamine 5'-phosphate oxidase family protein n=1 Tax=Rathayibacter soli TaxID=3144168 RepID=UPI0027E42667|nr:pyridoxamine 5'-phosphate oxidase family protein [Glaciibacter superstes]
MDEELTGWSPRGPVTELSDAHCWSRLRRAGFGRLAVSIDGYREIFPLDFHVDKRSVVFRTADGTKLRELIANPHVALEADKHGTRALVRASPAPGDSLRTRSYLSPVNSCRRRRAR